MPALTQNKNGITLIALVVTIIVLMILTGVTLNLVAGSNGIIMRAISATQEHQKSADKEMLELWYVGFILDIVIYV